MTITDIIEACVSGLATPFTFVEGDKAYANLSADNISGNIAWLDYPIVATVRQGKGGGFAPSRPIKLLFCQKSDLDYTPEQHRAIEEAMELVCYKMITALQSHENIGEVIGDFQVIPIRNLTDSNLTGCFLQVTLRDILNLSVC
mgnify:CR=1 FL=1